jgi:predicted ATPase
VDQADALQDIQSTEAALSLLLDGKRLREGDSQIAAAKSLSQIPMALVECRARFAMWQKEQQRLTEDAIEKQLSQDKERDTARRSSWQGPWFGRNKKMSAKNRIVGPVCWLSLGRPPVLQPGGCYIYGPVGTGKTTVMDLFCLFGAGKWRVRRQHFHEFAYWVHSSLHQHRTTSACTACQSIPNSHCLAVIADQLASEVDILCFDEFAITNIADAVIVSAVLKLLWERRVAVVCTTNRAPEDLYKEGFHRDQHLPALVKLLRQNFSVVEVNDGCDHRASLHPEMPGPDKQRDAFIRGGTPDAALAQALLGEPVPAFEQAHMNLPWNRKLAVRCSSSGIACFHFDELCKTLPRQGEYGLPAASCSPLSAEDFISVADSFHTIFVHDIPHLTQEHHNEARRFTNLVDVLYERSVRMICHSQVALAEVLADVEALHAVKSEDLDGEGAEAFGVFQRRWEHMGKFRSVQPLKQKRSETLQYEKQQMHEDEHRTAVFAQRISDQAAAAALEGHTGSGWNAAPAGADLSAPHQGVAGVMVAAVGSLNETGFAARRAISRLQEMQSQAYLKAAMGHKALGASQHAV